MSRIKVRYPCNVCKGEGEYWDVDTMVPCENCEGKGYFMVEEDANEYLANRPEHLEFECAACGIVEGILRPRPNQIPTSWMNWGSTLLCGKCKVKVLYAGMVAMSAKVNELVDQRSK